MAKWITPLACTCLLLFLSTSASAAGGFDFYASAHGGIAMLEDVEATDSTLPGVTVDFGFDDSFTATGAVGLVGGQYRSELEFSYQKNDLDDISAFGITVPAGSAGIDGDVTALTGLVNAYYDFDLGGPLSPYVTAGLGIANLDAEFTVSGVPGVSIGDEDTVFAYQFGAGLGYAVTENVTLDARYRYLATSEPEFDTTTAEFKSHNIMLGVRFRF